MADEPKPKKIYSPYDRAAITCGRLCGRSSLSQQDYLAKLGVPREKSVNWTMYHAHKEIEKRAAKANRNRAESGTVPVRSNGQVSTPSIGSRHGVTLAGSTVETSRTVANGASRSSATPDSELSGEWGSRSTGLS